MTVVVWAPLSESLADDVAPLETPSEMNSPEYRRIAKEETLSRALVTSVGPNAGPQGGPIVAYVLRNLAAASIAGVHGCLDAQDERPDLFLNVEIRPLLMLYAAAWLQPEMIEAVLQRGGDPNRAWFVADSESSPLHFAISAIQVHPKPSGADDLRRRRAQTVQVLLRWGADPFLPDGQGRRALDFALETDPAIAGVFAGHSPACARELAAPMLARFLDDLESETASSMIDAAPRAAQFLEPMNRFGIKFDPPAVTEIPPLIRYLHLGRGRRAGEAIEEITVLWREADVDERRTLARSICEVHARLRDEAKIVRLLLDAGCAPNAPTNCESPLHAACEWSTPEVIDVLVARGANKYAMDQHGRRPIDLALERTDILGVVCAATVRFP